MIIWSGCLQNNGDDDSEEYGFRYIDPYFYINPDLQDSGYGSVSKLKGY